jgi:hypothetical protein
VLHARVEEVLSIRVRGYVFTFTDSRPIYLQPTSPVKGDSAARSYSQINLKAEIGLTRDPRELMYVVFHVS